MWVPSRTQIRPPGARRVKPELAWKTKEGGQVRNGGQEEISVTVDSCLPRSSCPSLQEEPQIKVRVWCNTDSSAVQGNDPGPWVKETQT